MKKDSYIQIFTTTPRRRDAEKIARILIQKRVAGCVQIAGPVQSLYWWKGKKERSKEFLCIIKTTKQLYSKLEGVIKSVHPYTVPEILAFSVVAGNRDYLKWLSAETHF